ncbi:GH92 family glycosyl hydrolase [Prevotella sp. E13-17]|uniref:GH92 family glycosyl hydrolase n=1 Tax=Prevotella sp. E13-17 TaxID=2913616 RepID=UPI001EDA283F|nr:GH92 family glycosyl hydrolase [Prevotella sp. E13-17]UKK51808.1 GH92 family glycosyl hydrolase [Prevotella sp. E13-17]
MKTRFVLLLWLSGLTASMLATDHTSYVNPFIGTQTDETGALSGSTFPGATMPQGMVQLSPETEQMVTWDPCSGYDYNRDSIYGFTHTHLSGTGCTDLIDVSLMPLSHEVNAAELSRGVFGQRYSHQAEAARPGYYMVELQESGVRVELSATVRTGIHRYTFPQGKPQTIVLDLDRGTYRGEAYYTGRRAYQIIQSQMRVVDDHTIEGFRVITGWAKLRKVYFRAEFSRPFSQRLLMDGRRNVGGSPVVNGRSLRGALSFDPADGRELTVKVAISPVDNLGARKNMKAEAQSWNFNDYTQAAHNAWEKALACIDVDGTQEQKTIFYTGLYHVLMQPNTMSDVDGRYMDTNFEIKQMPRGEAYHSTFSLWDTFRAAHPLYTLIAPDVAAQFVRDMVRHHQTYGYLPIWDLWGQDNYCMIGNHAIPVLADAILAELPGIDVDEAYQAMVESSTRSHLNSPFEVWEKYGYMPQTLQNTSVSITLEQAFDDWCVAAVAKKLGRKADYERFIRRSEFYRNLFDAKTGFFRAKDERGNWIEPFDPLSYENPSFIEGNAWQYMWFVPQNPKGLIELLGGEKNFLKKLDENFSLTATSGEVNGNASGFIGQYAHGNEPSHHTVYLYNFAGRPQRTQELVEQVRSQFYNATPCGYAGNDDCGQMSAWYIFSSLGFYPFNAGAAEYVIGTPLFKRATLHLAGGRDFVVTAPNKTAQKVHVKRVKLNGKTMKELVLSHQQIMEGGTLQFDM